MCRSQGLKVEAERSWSAEPPSTPKMSHAHQAQQTKSKRKLKSPYALAAVRWLED